MKSNIDERTNNIKLIFIRNKTGKISIQNSKYFVLRYKLMEKPLLLSYMEASGNGIIKYRAGTILESPGYYRKYRR